jgi:hypothetical protein
MSEPTCAQQQSINRRTFMTGLLLAPQFLPAGAITPASDAQFRNPPAAARPWVYWFWINGNISKEGITADLEALKRVGVGGALWMEVSGPWWAPDGDVVPLSPRWHEAFQWAVRECQRLGLQFDVTVDFGYGSGGPHITPELSMQQLVWSEQEVEGGQPVAVALEKAQVKKDVSAWLRLGAKIGEGVLKALEQSDSYRDVAVVAIPLAASPADRAYRIPAINTKTGLHAKAPHVDLEAIAQPGAVTPIERVIDLTAHMDRDGRLTWDAPAGKWLIMRYGHASNFKMTRPSPAAAVGLECDRLAKAGIEAHYQAFLKKVIDGAGPSAGRALSFVHIDSWEAGGQNWTATFPAEFRARRGYDLRPWLPVLTGRVVGSAELSERFLWDVRTTVSEMIRDNYAGRLRELAHEHGMKLSIEAYGNLSIDNLAYAGISDMPMSEFWAMGNGMFPTPGGFEKSSKAMASAGHVYGKPVVGAESFTSGRGWRDHPFTLKAMGDKAFSRGINRLVFHLSAHQAYNHMIPGLTHRKWGQHFQRHNTWFNYSRPWVDYVTRCQYLLQQGTSVADVCYCFGEGAALAVDDMSLAMPEGYDYDLCSSETVLRMRVEKGRLVLPSGMSYRYLLLPASDRMTLPLARKIRDLVAAGARVIGVKKPKGSPGLTDYPHCDTEVAGIAASLWDTGRVITGKDLAEVFREDQLQPDLEAEGLLYLHRRIGDADVYFVSHQENSPLDRVCTFRVTGKHPELWDPETGEIRALPEFTERDGRISTPLRFEPAQSWFVVFRPGKSVAGARTNFAQRRELRQVDGSWQVTFDPRWGGPGEAVGFEQLTDWSKHPDPRVRYYSGTATYRKSLTLSATEASGKQGRLLLDLGAVEVMARVRLNGKECAVAWKPPYLADITGAVRTGANELEIDVVNLWINRMIGDEQLPEDSTWKDFETLTEWPAWFKEGKPRPSGRYTFTTCKHYTKDSPLVPAGLLGPVTLKLSAT